MELLPPAYVRSMTGGYVFTGVCLFGGGVPGLRFSGGGSQVSDFRGGGVPGLRFSGGGYPVSVKGKIFDTRFGLIHVQTGKKIFVKGPPPPPRIARNCYGHVAGGMPLAFTQEDFLVLLFSHLSIVLIGQNITVIQKKKHHYVAEE